MMTAIIAAGASVSIGGTSFSRFDFQCNHNPVSVNGSSFRNNGTDYELSEIPSEDPERQLDILQG